jgi:c-di-GMP-related signal transduction protein
VKPATAASQTSDGKQLTVPGQRFVARQPIFDRTQKVFGYELLFRDGLENCFSAEPNAASLSTLDTSLLFGLNTLCDGHLAFVNCTRDTLLKDLVTLLPPQETVVEILETVEPGDRVVAACKRLRTAGYLIALDDFAPNDPRSSLCEYADILKVDFRATRIEERAGLMRRFGNGRKMLAEKLETPQEFRQARDMGFALFQGYFFRRPEILMAREVPANKLH